MFIDHTLIDAHRRNTFAMKSTLLSIILVLLASVEGFVPTIHEDVRGTTSLFAKYNTMEEILAKFPSDKPVLINFYDAKTENDIKADIFRAKELLKDRATLVSIKQQDYPEIAKKWDCGDKSPAMILFQGGAPVARLYEETHYLEIVAKFGQFCPSS